MNRVFRLITALPTAPCFSTSSLRPFSIMASKYMKVLGFNEVKEGLGTNSILLVDVRNVNERKDPGRIPGSVNVPCKLNDMYINCKCMV